jgi:hypothetical protein
LMFHRKSPMATPSALMADGWFWTQAITFCINPFYHAPRDK